EYGVSSKSLAVTSEFEEHAKGKLFDERISIDDQHDGFAKKIDESLAAALNRKEIITNAIKKILPREDEGLLLVTTGPGATGLGSTLVILEILFEEFNRIPPILTLLPEVFENSRVQFNAAKFLYEVAFKTGSRGNALILLDNKPALSEMSIPFSKLSRERLETIPNAIADLLVAAFETSISPEFDANVSDLFEVMHTPGVAVFVSEQLGAGDEGVDSSRIQDVISDSVIDTTSLSKDKVYEARNAFVAIFNISHAGEKLSFQTEFETRKLYQEFRETNPFVKFVQPNVDDPNLQEPKLRAIIAGLPVPTRIIQIMQIARDSRKRVLLDEKLLALESLELGIETIEKLEDELGSYF
ncbi:MAG: hypothetical protein ACW98K_10840, partial [Candidatus Kariarchaeaceae archaeon]